MRLVAGFVILYSHGGQNLAMNTAVSIADGNSYDESACGDIDRTDDHRQYAVKIVGRTPLGSKTGNRRFLSLRWQVFRWRIKNAHIRITATMETVAASRNTNFIIVSLVFFI